MAIGAEVVGGLAESFGEVVGYAIADLMGVLPSRAGAPHGAAGGDDAAKVQQQILKQHRKDLARVARPLVQKELWRAENHLTVLQAHWKHVEELKQKPVQLGEELELLGEGLEALVDTAVVATCIIPFIEVTITETLKNQAPHGAGDHGHDAHGHDDHEDDHGHGDAHGDAHGAPKGKKTKKAPEKPPTPVTEFRITVPKIGDAEMEKIRGRIREFLADLNQRTDFKEFLIYVDGLAPNWLEDKAEMARRQVVRIWLHLKEANKTYALDIPMIPDPDKGSSFLVERVTIGMLIFIVLAVKLPWWLATIGAVGVMLAYHHREKISKAGKGWWNSMRASAPSFRSWLGGRLQSALGRRPRARTP